MTYVNWSYGEPNNGYTCGENWAAMNWNSDPSGSWNDLGTCTTEHSGWAIIERPMPTDDWITNPSNGHVYKAINCGWWQDCETAAVAEDAHLVTINDQAEQNWLTQTFGTSQNYWIGFTDEGQEGNWFWIRGEEVTYTNWAPGQPNNNYTCGENWAVMNWNADPSGSWNDLGTCTTEYSGWAIIEKQPFVERYAAKDCLPLEPGTVWKYLLNGQNEVTRKVLGKKVNMNGVDTSAVKYVEEGYTNYFTNDSDGILLHGQSERSIKGVFTPPIRFSGVTLGSGDSFHSEGVATVKRGAQTINVGFTADTTIGATENIAVPAGNFDAVIISLSLNLGGYAFSETLYLAEGIGIVKDVNTDSSGTLTADLVYTNAGIYDLAIMGITPPKKVTLSSGTPSRTSLLKLKVQNKGSFPEIIEDAIMLTNLITVTVESLGTCPAPSPILHTGKPQKPFPITLKPGKTLTVYYDVTFDCANDPEQGTPDYRFSAVVNRAALGGKADINPVNDTCPRDSTSTDKGCSDIPTDVVMK